MFIPEKKIFNPLWTSLKHEGNSSDFKECPKRWTHENTPGVSQFYLFIIIIILFIYLFKYKYKYFWHKRKRSDYVG